MGYIAKPGIVRIDPTITNLLPDQFSNEEPIQSYPFGPSTMRITNLGAGFPEETGDVITSRTGENTGNQIFVGTKTYFRTFGIGIWNTWRELGATSGVTSVNGKTGDVQLTASDVGAPTAQQHDQLEQKVDAHLAEFTQFKTQTQTDMGDKSNLLTTNKSNLVAAINEVFISGNNVKSDTVGALLSVDPNLPITPNSPWVDIISAIGQISTGKKWASGVYTVTSETIMAQYIGSTDNDTTRFIQVAGLEFIPSVIIAYIKGTTSSNSLNATVYIEDGPFTNVPYGQVFTFSFARQSLTSTSSRGYKVGVHGVYVGETGFRIPASATSGEYTWVAFE